jgi:hypothetical protein
VWSVWCLTSMKSSMLIDYKSHSDLYGGEKWLSLSFCKMKDICLSIDVSFSWNEQWSYYINEFQLQKGFDKWNIVFNREQISVRFGMKNDFLSIYIRKTYHLTLSGRGTHILPKCLAEVFNREQFSVKFGMISCQFILGRHTI